MAKDKATSESLTGMAKQTAEQITGRTQEATENYKIQTEFMTTQMNSFNEQAKNIGEIYTKTATAVRAPFGLST